MPSGRVTRWNRAARLAHQEELAALDGPRLPPELFRIIVGHALTDLLGDLVLVPENLRVWEAGSVLLQVSSAFRTFVIKFMEPLWGGEFPVGNGLYKQTMTLCRRYSEYAHWWPHDFFYASKRPSAFWYSILEDSRIPIVVLLKHIISGVARSLARIKIPWREGVLHPYILDGLTAFVDEYSKLAYQTKRVLFARVEQYLEEEYIPGIRASVLDGAIETLSKLLLLGVKNHFKLPETSFLLSALSPQVDVDQINSYSTRMLVACHTFNSDLKRLCEERLAPCYHGAHERDVALTRYNFSLSAWNKLLSMMVFAETTSPATADACWSWKQVFVTIVSEGDRRRLLPNVMVDTPLRGDTK